MELNEIPVEYQRTKEGITLIVRKVLGTFGFNTFTIDEAVTDFCKKHHQFLEQLRDPRVSPDNLIIFIDLWIPSFTAKLHRKRLDWN